jgi:hypothetical protein
VIVREGLHPSVSVAGKGGHAGVRVLYNSIASASVWECVCMHVRVCMQQILRGYTFNAIIDTCFSRMSDLLCLSPL